MKKILLIGSSGFLGKNVLDKINSNNQVHVITGKADVDITNYNDFKEFASEIDFEYIINCAAFVGGVSYGYEYPAELLSINSAIANNVFKIAKEKSVKLLVNPIPNCVYPGHLNIYEEKDLLSGPPHESVFYYALSKRLAIALSSSYYKQYNLSSCSVIMSNMYGPNDHFEENRSHAMGALINKIYNAKQHGDLSVDVWGSGKQIREWLYVKDGADALMVTGETAMGKYPTDVIDVLSDVIKETEKTLKFYSRTIGKDTVDSISGAISHAACTIAKDLDLKSIVTMTQSGGTARMVSSFRPSANVYAMTTLKSTFRSLSIIWGVIPVLVNQYNSADEMPELAKQKLLDMKVLNKEEKFIITGGVPVNVPGTTNYISIL